MEDVQERPDRVFFLWRVVFFDCTNRISFGRQTSVWHFGEIRSSDTIFSIWRYNKHEYTLREVESFFEKLIVAHLVEKFPSFMETES
jgi:hypothetical protein